MSKTGPIRDLALAATLLTALPLGARPVDAGERSDAASYFALVGLAFGGALAGTLWLSHRFFYGLSGVAAVLVVAVLAFATRLLHWDGLADVADAWFVAPGRRLDVMADSAVGAFGAAAVVLVALLQTEALVELARSQVTVVPVLLAPVFGRLAATFSAWLGRPARPGGLGDSVVRRPSALGSLATASVLLVSILIVRSAGTSDLLLLVVVVTGLLLALGVPHVIALRFGGVTGDTMGASVLLVETGVMISILLSAGILRLLGMSA